MYRVRTTFTGVTGTPWVNNLFFASGGELGGEQALAASYAFWNGIKGAISNLITATVGSEIALMDEASGEIQDILVLAPQVVVGGSSEGMGPKASQGVVSARTGVYRLGRPVIGKIFIPALARNQYTNTGDLIGTLPADILVQANKLLTTSTGGLLAGPGVYSRPRPIGFGQPVPIPGALTPVTSYRMTTKPGVLRSRRD